MPYITPATCCVTITQAGRRVVVLGLQKAVLPSVASAHRVGVALQAEPYSQRAE